MAVSRTGVFSEDFAIGTFTYGDGAPGGLTVTAGSVLSLPVPGDEGMTVFGLGSGGVGTLAVSQGELRLGPSAGYNGLVMGANGGVGGGVVDSGLLRIEAMELSGVQIGTGLGSFGDFKATNGGRFEVVSEDFSYFNVGVDWGLTGGGRGRALFEDGATLLVESGSDATDFVRFDIGASTAGTDGELVFTNSMLVAQTAGEIQASIGVDGATGTMTVETFSEATFATGLAEFAGLRVGQGENSVGELNVLGTSTLSMTNATGETYLNIGRDAGDGKLVLNAGTLRFDAATWAGFRIGSTGGVGDARFVSSTMEVIGGKGTYFDIGGDGGEGVADLSGADLRVVSNGDAASGGSVGRGADGNSLGELRVADHASMTVEATGAGNAYLNFGRDVAGIGIVDIDVLSELSVLATGTGTAHLNVGLEGGYGDLTLSRSSLTIRSAADVANLRIGASFEEGDSDGSVWMEAASHTVVEGNDAFVTVSQDAGSTGALTLVGGSTVELRKTAGATGDTYLGIGYRGQTDGRVMISGPGSRIFGVDMTEVGIDPLDRSAIPDRFIYGGGNGLLTIEQQGRLDTELLVVGRGGHLVLSGGTVEGSSLEFRHGELTLSGSETSHLVGNAEFVWADVIFDLGEREELGDAPILSHTGGSFVLDDLTGIRIDPGRAALQAGERVTLLETDQGALSLDEDALRFFHVAGATGWFQSAFVVAESAGRITVDFVAVNAPDSRSYATVDLELLGLSTAMVVERLDGNALATDGDVEVVLATVRELAGTSGDDVFDMQALRPLTLWGRDGDDLFLSGRENDTFHGGAGSDTVDYSGAVGAVTVDLLAGRAKGGGGYDRLDGIENVEGSSANDWIAGDAGDNDLAGGAGNDVLKGRGGNDTFRGGEGNDRMRAAEGNDAMLGGAGNDILYGLAGNDELSGEDGSDYMYGGQDADILRGGAGDDFLRGNLGSDVLEGGAGSDDLRGGGSDDELMGAAGDDFLLGGGGRDLLIGGAGDDVLIGGHGAGHFDGVRDTFVYAATSQGAGGFDRIRDFENGIDRIDLTAFGFTDFDAEVFVRAADTGSAMRLNFGNGDVLYIDSFSTGQFDLGDVFL